MESSDANTNFPKLSNRSLRYYFGTITYQSIHIFTKNNYADKDCYINCVCTLNPPS